jgi:D-xylose transport system substrate-binding protein
MRSLRIVEEHEVRDWSPARAQAIVIDAWKKSKGNLDAILAPNDAIAEGVIETLKSLGVAGRVLVTGQDGEPEALERIRAGTQSMSVRKDAEKLVSATLETISKLAAGKAAGVTSVFEFEGQKTPAILLDPEIITSENRDSHR